MSPRIAWVICFVVSLFLFTLLADDGQWSALVPLLFAFASFGFLYNRGAGVDGRLPGAPR